MCGSVIGYTETDEFGGHHCSLDVSVHHYGYNFFLILKIVTDVELVF